MMEMTDSEALRELAALVEARPEIVYIQAMHPVISAFLPPCADPQPGVSFHAHLARDEMVLYLCLAATLLDAEEDWSDFYPSTRAGDVHRERTET